MRNSALIREDIHQCYEELKFLERRLETFTKYDNPHWYTSIENYRERELELFIHIQRLLNEYMMLVLVGPTPANTKLQESDIPKEDEVN